MTLESGPRAATYLDVSEDVFPAHDLVARVVDGRDLMQHLAVVDGRAVQGGVLVPFHVACEEKRVEVNHSRLIIFREIREQWRNVFKASVNCYIFSYS